MTSQSPRIYTYKITFEEVPYYYYGSKKEKKFDEEYWGSPVTNKWCWELYTPKKQILELFDYTDEGYDKALEIEGRLIKFIFNIDKWCLNVNYNGKISLKYRKLATKRAKELGVGVYGFTKEQRIENGKRGGQKLKQNKIGIFSLTPEQKGKNGKKGSMNTNSQKWMCLETGHITNSGALSMYQKARNIDTSKRKRLE